MTEHANKPRFMALAHSDVGCAPCGHGALGKLLLTYFESAQLGLGGFVRSILG